MADTKPVQELLIKYKQLVPNETDVPDARFAQFKNFSVAHLLDKKDGRVIPLYCGEINQRDSTGVFKGWTKMFAYLRDPVLPSVMIADDDMNANIIALRCKGSLIAP